MLLWYRVPLSAPMLVFPCFLLLQVVFTIGVAFIFATSTLFRDVRHLLEVGVAMLFWTTPIVYELRHVPERFGCSSCSARCRRSCVAYQQIFYLRSVPNAIVWLVAVASSGWARSSSARCVFLAYEDGFTEQL